MSNILVCAVLEFNRNVIYELERILSGQHCVWYYETLSYEQFLAYFSCFVKIE
jgi:hypothetical protein